MKRLKFFVLLIILMNFSQEILTETTLKSVENSWPRRVLITNDNGINDIKIIELFRLKFELITQSDIKNKLLPMIRRGTYPLRDEMVSQLEEFLSPFTSLTREEYEILDNFYNSGNLDFDVLIPQKEIQKKIKISPSFKWKIHTIKKNL